MCFASLISSCTICVFVPSMFNRVRFCHVYGLDFVLLANTTFSSDNLSTWIALFFVKDLEIKMTVND